MKSVTFLANDATDPSIPRVLCPRCGAHMRMAELMTDLVDHEAMHFDCKCGFEYRMATQARAGG
jgi:hypothetical protein